MSTNSPSEVFGPVLIGAFVNTFLLGSALVQLYVFEKHQHKTKDTVWLRLLVRFVFLICTVQTALGVHGIWYYAVAGWDDPSRLLPGPSPTDDQVVSALIGVVTLLIQSMYSWRIWTLSTSVLFRSMACLVVVLSLLQFSTALAAPISPDLDLRQFLIIISINLVASFTADILIAACMITMFAKARASTIWVDSRSLYDRLIVLTLQTGLVTTIVAGLTLALFTHNQSQNLWEGPYIVLGNLYTISFLSSLNDRVFRPSPTSHDQSIIPEIGTSISRTSDSRAYPGSPQDIEFATEVIVLSDRNKRVISDNASYASAETHRSEGQREDGKWQTVVIGDRTVSV